jgi:hypothetical protein
VTGSSPHPLLSAWRALPKGQKSRLAQDIARDVIERRLAREPLQAIGRALKFRIDTLHRASEAALSAAIQDAFPLVEPFWFFQTLVQIHFGSRAEVLSRTYDVMGVEHDGPHAPKEVLDAPLDVDQVRAAFASLPDGTEDADLLFCLRVMRHACSASWRPGVDAAITALAERDAPPAPIGPAEHDAGSDIAESESPSEAAVSEVAEAESAVPTGRDALEFTHLDRLLIRAVVSSLNGVEGSVGELERSDLVLELVHLNESREQSWFHLGFLDSLENRPLAELQQGDNRERRAWYLSGFLHGTFRRGQSLAMLAQLENLSPGDLERLLGGGSDGGAQLSQLVVPSLLSAERPEDSIPWLGLYAGLLPRQLVPAVLEWSRRALVDLAPQRVADVLEATLAGLAANRSSEEGPPNEVLRALRRRLAIAWRRLRRMDEARGAVEGLLDGAEPGAERGRLLCDLVLIELGIGSLEDLRLGHPETRPTLAQALQRTKPLLEEAASFGDSVPVAHYLLGLAQFLSNPTGEAEIRSTSASLSRALSAMSRDEPGFWRATGIQAQCEFLHALCELRLLDEGLAVPAVQHLTSAIETRSDLPEDLLFDAIQHAAAMNAPQISPLVQKLFEQQPERVLRELDLREVARRNPELRRIAATRARDLEESLRPRESWRVWKALLHASLDATGERDLETAREALDSLERLAQSASLSDQFLALLGDARNWDCVWSDEDAIEARLATLRLAGRWYEAAGDVERLAWQALEAGGSDADDLIELARGAGVHPDSLEALERQRDSLRARDEELPSLVEGRPLQPFRILFLGGNETQERYEDRLRQEIAETYPQCEIDFEFPAWSSNWGRLVDRLMGRLDTYSALVIMRFVRTELGREMRRQASRLEIPWVACTGRGHESLLRSLREAAQLAASSQKQLP